MRVDLRKSGFKPIGFGINRPPPPDWQEREDQHIAGESTERRIECLTCLDMGFTSSVVWKVRVRGWYSQAWYCDCDNGRRQEAGYWFGVCYPVHENRRVNSPRGQRELDTYLRAKPDRRPWLPDAVEQLRLAYEEAKKRKKAEIYEGKAGYESAKYQSAQLPP
jgi:hypothetical protein